MRSCPPATRRFARGELVAALDGFFARDRAGGLRLRPDVVFHAAIASPIPARRRPSLRPKDPVNALFRQVEVDLERSHLVGEGVVLTTDPKVVPRLVGAACQSRKLRLPGGPLLASGLVSLLSLLVIEDESARVDCRAPPQERTSPNPSRCTCPPAGVPNPDCCTTWVSSCANSRCP